MNGARLGAVLSTVGALATGYLMAMVPASRAARRTAKSPYRVAQLAPPAMAADASAEAGPDDAPTLSWRRCGDGVGECALLAVPLDHRNPGGRLVGLAVRRIAASDERQRLGVLVVNPGGPGRPVVDDLATIERMMRATMPEVTARFDLVAMDVRGTGASGPRPSCGTRHPVDQIDRCFEPGEGRCWGELAEAARDRAEMCARSVERDLLVGMTQENAARDLDVLRVALGEKSLSFYGFSAAARFGGLYATLHPDHVRAAVFDSPTSPTLSREETYQLQAVAYSKAADRLFAWCVAERRCGATAGESVDHFSARLQAALRQRPFARDVDASTEGATLSNRVAHLLDRLRRGAWTPLDAELAALTRDDPHPMDAAVTADTRRRFAPGVDASGASWQGVVDDPTPGRAVDWAWRGKVPRWTNLFEVVWRMNLVVVESWALPMTAQRPLSAYMGVPALVIIGQHDPATPPVAGAAFLAALHQRAWTVAYEGEGHARSLDDGCLAAAVGAYLVAPTHAPIVDRCGQGQ